MNHIYRSLWNEKTGTFVAVSEITKRGKKASTGGGVVGAVFALKALAASLLLAYGATGYALPVGGAVVGGSAAISSNAGSMTVTQTSQNAALNWQQFNIGQGEAVRFVQPNSSAVALNRVLGADPSSILGSLSANGKVFLVNPNGILFGAGASVNVGGLVASTRNISDSDFMAGNYKFAGTGTGSVLNQGSIHADGGYVALLGANVSNQGTISARLGTVALAAGNAITLDVAGDGLINVAIDQGATNALINNGGLIRADGGQVLLTAQAAGNLLQTAVNNTGVIQAQSIDNHDGTIKLLGDMQSGTVNVGGTLDASAPNGGNGGFIETSAAQVKVSDTTRITTASAMGLNGSWLIDPVDFTIAAGSASLTSSGIGATTLSTSLANGNVSIATGSTTTGNGDIFVNSAVSWAANKLTLSAHRNININANLNASATASLALNFGQGAAAFNNTSNIITNNGAAVNLPAGTTNFSTKQGSDGAVRNYTVITSLGAEGSTTTTDLQGMQGNRGLNYALGASIDATATSGWNSGAGFAQIGAFGLKFSGSFDGLGHTISNLTINRPTTDNVGLFGYGNSDNTSLPTVVRNVGLVGGSVTGRTNVGGLLGKSSGLIFNSYNTGAVTGSSNVGGLVGTNQWATIDNSYALGTVTGSGNNVGGLVGNNSVGFQGSAISNSHAAGTVSGSSNVGGLVGSNDGSSLSNSYATGAVTGSGDNIGGLVGTNSSSASIANSYATGAVTSSGNNIGGLVGTNSSASIANSYATGAVTGGGYVGGLVGANTGSVGGNADSYGNNGNGGSSATIDNSYATGAVSGSSAVGGLVGGNLGGNGGDGFLYGTTYGSGGAGGAATINHSYAAGAVSGNSFVGGLIGKNAIGAVGTANGGYGGVGGIATSSNSFWNTTTSGQSTSAGGLGMTTAQMQTQANFTSATAANGNANPGWDMSGTWIMYEGHTSPLLRSFMTALTVTAADATKTYDGLAYSGGNGLTYSTTPNMNNLLGTASYSSGINVGSTTITAGGLYSNQQGYIISYAAGTLTVNKADLALSGTRTYDGTSAVAGSVLTATGVHGETFAITGSGDTTNLASKNAQTGSTLATVTGLALGTSGNGGLSGNYNALSTTGSAVTIGKANLTVTGVTVNNKPYDGTTLATLAGGTPTGLISGDTVTLIEAGTFATPNAGNGIAVTAALSLGGPSAGNYSVIQPTGLTANITAPATTNPVSATDSDLRYQAAIASTASNMSAVASQGTTADAPPSTRTGDAPPSIQTFTSSAPGGLTGLNLSITGNGVNLPPGVQSPEARDDKD